MRETNCRFAGISDGHAPLRYPSGCAGFGTGRPGPPYTESVTERIVHEGRQPGTPAEQPEDLPTLSLSERRLIANAQRGDATALRELWQEHRRWVAGILLAYKPRQSELEDLLQEVATAMVKRIDTLRDPGLLKPWLRSVAINAARLSARGHRRRPEGNPLPFDESASNGGMGESEHHQGVDMTASRREEGQRLLSLLLELPEAYREPLLLRSLKGLGYREISAITGLPETTIETRIARGRRMLRDRAHQQQDQSEGKPEGSLSEERTTR